MRTIYLVAAALCLTALAARADGVNDKFRLCRSGQGQAAVDACTWYLGAGYNLSRQDSAFAHILRGDAYLDLGKNEEALADFAAATDVQPRNADAWYNHAIVATRLNKDDVAISDLSQAIALRPDWTEAYVVRAELNLSAGHAQAALDDANKALQLEPANTQAPGLRDRATARLGAKP